MALSDFWKSVMVDDSPVPKEHAYVDRETFVVGPVPGSFIRTTGTPLVDKFDPAVSSKRIEMLEKEVHLLKTAVEILIREGKSCG